MNVRFLILMLASSLALSAQSYFTAEAAEQKLTRFQSNLNRLYLKQLALERINKAMMARWNDALVEAQNLEGVLACADSDWFYTSFEPQVYRLMETVAEYDSFISELSKLTTLTSHKFHEMSMEYAQRLCSLDAVRASVQQGRNAYPRSRPELKGVAPNSN